jgi:hypothetical protein
MKNKTVFFTLLLTLSALNTTPALSMKKDLGNNQKNKKSKKDKKKIVELLSAKALIGELEQQDIPKKRGPLSPKKSAKKNKRPKKTDFFDPKKKLTEKELRKKNKKNHIESIPNFGEEYYQDQETDYPEEENYCPKEETGYPEEEPSYQEGENYSPKEETGYPEEETSFQEWENYYPKENTHPEEENGELEQEDDGEVDSE